MDIMGLLGCSIPYQAFSVTTKFFLVCPNLHPLKNGFVEGHTQKPFFSWKIGFLFTFAELIHKTLFLYGGFLDSAEAQSKDSGNIDGRAKCSGRGEREVRKKVWEPCQHTVFMEEKQFCIPQTSTGTDKHEGKWPLWNITFGIANSAINFSLGHFDSPVNHWQLITRYIEVIGKSWLHVVMLLQMLLLLFCRTQDISSCHFLIRIYKLSDSSQWEQCYMGHLGLWTKFCNE